MVNQPKSLYNLCIDRSKEVFRFNWQVVIDNLPKLISDELLRSWLQCTEAMETSDSDMSEILQFFANNTIDWENLSLDDFLMLMQHPEDEVPEFAFEKNHCLKSYYLMVRLWSNIDKKICETCFIRESKFYKPYSDNLWRDKRITFKKISDHTVVKGEDLLSEYIWDPDNWCELCICNPLFKIFDESDCKIFFNFHTRKRTHNCYDSNYSTDDDSDDEDFFVIKNVKGNVMDDTMYNYLKINKLN